MAQTMEADIVVFPLMASAFALGDNVGAHQSSGFKNCVEGVGVGFTKKLEINGVGYRAAVAGNKLNMSLGFSHPVEFLLPAGVSATVAGNVISLTSADKTVLGETAARIRKIRKPEPYKGKGVKYSDEIIRRKAGKAAAKGK